MRVTLLRGAERALLVRVVAAVVVTVTEPATPNAQVVVATLDQPYSSTVIASCVYYVTCTFVLKHHTEYGIELHAKQKNL